MAEEKKPITKTQSGMMKFSNIYSNMVESIATDRELKFSDSQKMNVTLGAQKIFTLCKKDNIDINTLDQNNVNQILFNLALLNLNINAVPHECYMIIRKVYVGKENGKSIYRPTIELGIEGDGNDALVRKYGVNVKSLSAPFIVREGDDFTLPYFDGEKMCAPVWKPKSFSNKATHVFYILTKTDGTKEYPICDRESVATNLKAHILQNIMWASPNDKKTIAKKIENMSLDQLLSDESIRTCKGTDGEDITVISKAYLNAHSQEEMIIRKMRNNCLKKYPKCFDDAFLSEAYESTFEDTNANNFKIEKNPADTIVAEFEEKGNSESVEPLIDTTSYENVDENGVVAESKETTKVKDRGF